MQQQANEPKVRSEFTSFMRAYQDMVFSTAARLTGSDSQAEDIAQDVFVKAYESFAQLRGSPAAGGWLRTVATHLGLNYLTRHRKRWRLFSELRSGHEEDDGADPEPEVEIVDMVLEALDAEQRREAIDEALRQLPDHQRVPLVLYHFEDFSYQDIAARLAASLPKIKTDIRRGRAALLQRLQARSIEP